MRLRVLISAYACNPAEGSEPAVGWRWAMEMAQHCDLTVLTRTNNQDDIEREVSGLPDDALRPEFIYFDLGPRLRRIKKIRGLNQWYYLLWQRRARRTVAAAVDGGRFDLLHHVTYASYRYWTALDGHGVPVLWGPVGGAERVPWKLLRLDSARSFLSEATRNLMGLLQQIPFLRMMPRAARSERVIASTRETQELLRIHGVEAGLMPTIGIDLPDRPPDPRERSDGDLRIIFVGNLLFLKGIHLALEGLAKADFPFRLTIVGDGSYAGCLRKIVRRGGLEERVDFVGRVPMDQVAGLLDEADVFLFPSLHDSGGMALIEAMELGLPPVCLDCGGPGIAVDDTCGTAVPVTGSAVEISTAIAAALSRYAADPELYREHSAGAIKRVWERYDWRRKAELMAEVYRSLARE